MMRDVSFQEIESVLYALDNLQRSQVEALKLDVESQSKQIDLNATDKFHQLRVKRLIQKSIAYHFEQFKKKAQEENKDVPCKGILKASLESKKAVFYSKELFDSLLAIFFNKTKAVAEKVLSERPLTQLQ
jgi:hypothetical protein